MTNPISAAVFPCTSLPQTWLHVLILSLVLCSSSVQIINAKPDDANCSSRGVEVQWQILTKLNFSSQIRLHPHILLVVTVPWSGKSRSLMKDIARVVSNKQGKLDNLKLRLLYRSSDRMLADAIGAAEGITVIYYHHSLPYKYRGRLRVQNILSSVDYLMSLLPEELPLKTLTTPTDLKMFLQSTDKALLLMEFCGWTPRLLSSYKNNDTNNGFEGTFGTNLNGEIDEALAAEGKENQGMQCEEMNCSIDNGFSLISQLGEFTSANVTAILEAENNRPSDAISCTFEEFQQYELFLLKFFTAVREFFLPPERLRFGLVPEKSLLSNLTVGDSGSWSMMLHIAGCPSCSVVFREVDDLKTILQKHTSLVTELEGDGLDFMPANKPSVLLFIDRSSESLQVRTESKEALHSFRELALLHPFSNHIMGQNANPGKFSVKAYQASKSTSAHPLEEMTPKSQKFSAMDKMSIMIIQEGKPVSLDKLSSELQANSLHKILGKLLQQKKEMKLSSLAKDVGFQLLSDDFDVKVAEALSAETNVDSKQVSTEPFTEEFVKSNTNFGKDQILRKTGTGASEVEYGEQPTCTDAEPPEHNDDKAFVETMTQSFAKPDNSYTDEVVTDAEGVKRNLSVVFFFSDGDSSTLGALTAGSTIPSVVIINPISQQHYVCPEAAVHNYSLLSDCLDRFVNGSLLPYQCSKPIIQNPREAPHPPFVNLDFHEADAIPQVTADTFSEHVIGNLLDSTNACNAWKKDVLVLFSNNWCGFCQRMELVVREVYRAFKGYLSMLKNESRNNISSLTGNVKNAMSNSPLIYLMDCTLNDCSLILKSMVKKEVYPSLLLFAAERKDAVFYGGDTTVSDIIKFISDNGSNCHAFSKEKGILWTAAKRGGSCQNLFDDASQIAVNDKAPLGKDENHKFVLEERSPTIANQYRPRVASNALDTGLQVVTGSILIATDMLLNVDPFDKSRILIVKVNQSSGFQGLIINRHITWDAFKEPDERLKILKGAPLSLGGPVVSREMPLVALARKFINDQYPEVVQNIYFIDQWATFHLIDGLKLGNQSAADYWFFLGYSSWSWDQLYNEIAEGAWNISGGNVEQLDWPSG